MSKKDYQMIARAIYERRESMRPIANFMDRRTHYEELTATLADAFAADNPRFNRALFLEACETGRCEGMRAA